MAAAAPVGELDLDLDAFEGPFDLLLTLVLRDELPLGEIDLAEIVIAFVEHLAARDELDLDACGEFLVLISALLELKARGLFPDEEAELSELEPEEAAEELARRLAEYRRAKEAAAWLAGRLAETRDRFFRLGRRRSPRRGPSRRSPRSSPRASPTRSARSRSSRLRSRPRTWRFASRRSRSSSSAGARCCGAAPGSTSTTRSPGSPGSRSRSPSWRCSSCAKQREIAIAQAAPVRADKDFPCRRRKEPVVDRPLRLIAIEPGRRARPDDRGAARRRLAAALRAGARRGDRRRRSDRVEDALELLVERFREGRSGIVLEHVAGGWAFRASRDAAEACARLFERPGRARADARRRSRRSRSSPTSGRARGRTIARIRGVNVDGVVAGLLERGLLAEAGRDHELGAVRYATTPLFERVFGLESLAELPRLDDIGADATEIRERLEAVAEKRRPSLGGRRSAWSPARCLQRDGRHRSRHSQRR